MADKYIQVSGGAGSGTEGDPWSFDTDDWDSVVQAGLNDGDTLFFNPGTYVLPTDAVNPFTIKGGLVTGITYKAIGKVRLEDTQTKNDTVYMLSFGSAGSEIMTFDNIDMFLRNGQTGTSARVVVARVSCIVTINSSLFDLESKSSGAGVGIYEGSVSTLTMNNCSIVLNTTNAALPFNFYQTTFTANNCSIGYRSGFQGGISIMTMNGGVLQATLPGTPLGTGVTLNDVHTYNIAGEPDDGQAFIDVENGNLNLVPNSPALAAGSGAGFIDGSLPADHFWVDEGLATGNNDGTTKADAFQSAVAATAGTSLGDTLIFVDGTHSPSLLDPIGRTWTSETPLGATISTALRATGDGTFLRVKFTGTDHKVTVGGGFKVFFNGCEITHTSGQYFNGLGDETNVELRGCLIKLGGGVGDRFYRGTLGLLSMHNSSVVQTVDTAIYFADDVFTIEDCSLRFKGNEQSNLNHVIQGDVFVENPGQAGKFPGATIGSLLMRDPDNGDTDFLPNSPAVAAGGDTFLPSLSGYGTVYWVAPGGTGVGPTGTTDPGSGYGDLETTLEDAGGVSNGDAVILKSGTYPPANISLDHTVDLLAEEKLGPLVQMDNTSALSNSVAGTVNILGVDFQSTATKSTFNLFSFLVTGFTINFDRCRFYADLDSVTYAPFAKTGPELLSFNNCEITMFNRQSSGSSLFASASIVANNSVIRIPGLNAEGQILGTIDGCVLQSLTPSVMDVTALTIIDSHVDGTTTINDGDPGFRDPDNGNFKLLPNSSVIAAGA